MRIWLWIRVSLFFFLVGSVHRFLSLWLAFPWSGYWTKAETNRSVPYILSCFCVHTTLLSPLSIGKTLFIKRARETCQRQSVASSGPFFLPTLWRSHKNKEIEKKVPFGLLLTSCCRVSFEPELVFFLYPFFHSSFAKVSRQVFLQCPAWSVVGHISPSLSLSLCRTSRSPIPHDTRLKKVFKQTTRQRTR